MQGQEAVVEYQLLTMKAVKQPENLVVRGGVNYLLPLEKDHLMKPSPAGVL